MDLAPTAWLMRLVPGLDPDGAKFALYGLGDLACLGAFHIGATFLKRARRPKSAKLEAAEEPLATAPALKEILAGSGDKTLLGVVPARRRWRFHKEPAPWLLTREHRERHMQIMGPTRSGKSQLLLSLCAQDMNARRPVFFMEAKGDVGDFAQFSRLARQTGRAADLRYFNPSDPRSMTFNPIRPIPGQDATSVANQISRAIGREPGGGGDSEYFKSVDYARIQTMAEVFMATGRGFTLKDAFYYFEFDGSRDRAYELCPDKSLVALARRQFEGKSADTSALTAHLRPWISGRLGELLNSYDPQIRLEDVFQAERLAYFAIPIGHMQVLANSLGRMVVAGLLGVAFKRQQMSLKPGPASVILDEFPEFATPVFASFIATVGSANLWTVFSHQDLGQLKKVEGIDPDVFFSALYSNSSGCKVFFNLPHPADAELIARAAGTVATVKTTEAVESGLFGDMGTGRKSLREVEEFVAHPNILRSLPPGMAVAWAHRRRPAVVSTAAAHAVIADESPVELPAVAGAAQEGLELWKWAERGEVRKTAGKDFAGSERSAAVSEDRR
jgi:type IV secretory pathway TraG/TraD family ATPase VirD4